MAITLKKYRLIDVRVPLRGGLEFTIFATALVLSASSCSLPGRFTRGYAEASSGGMNSFVPARSRTG